MESSTRCRAVSLFSAFNRRFKAFNGIKQNGAIEKRRRVAQAFHRGNGAKNQMFRDFLITTSTRCCARHDVERGWFVVTRNALRIGDKARPLMGSANTRREIGVKYRLVRVLEVFFFGREIGRGNFGFVTVAVKAHRHEKSQNTRQMKPDTQRKQIDDTREQGKPVAA